MTKKMFFHPTKKSLCSLLVSTKGKAMDLKKSSRCLVVKEQGIWKKMQGQNPDDRENSLKEIISINKWMIALEGAEKNVS